MRALQCTNAVCNHDIILAAPFSKAMGRPREVRIVWLGNHQAYNRLFEYHD